RMLIRYGESNSGDSITRDILIPSDMPLHNLHYAIQKLFGWQNTHLRSFYLPEEIYSKLTGGTVKGWTDLVGVLFQPPSEAEHDVFWDDDYERGSFKVWLKKKYTGPYIYGGIMEEPEIAKQDVERFLEQFNMIEVRESFMDYIDRKEQDENAEMKIIKIAPIIDLTLEEMNASLIIEGGTESLLERLEVNKVIAAQGEEVDSNNLFPVTKELIYNYDFGDNWIVKISKYKDCEDLLKQNIVGEYELEEAEEIVLDKHKPVCINKEGLSVLDDVGGLSGFADLLGTIYEGEDKEEASGARAWAKSLGWSAAKISNKIMI
ncbi:MAG: plasmid pRiA4b ORF-3 family protein, partial [Tissierellia bacterium]|nr:plasmid pRiA4b ORF-3 family protein [Tissierellia bacterium]